MKKQHLNENIERYNPTVDFGLTEAQVAKRLELSLVNNVNKKYSKSYLNIFVNNVCTFFNLLGLICFIALLLTKAAFSNFFFVFFYIFSNFKTSRIGDYFKFPFISIIFKNRCRIRIHRTNNIALIKN